MRALLKKSAAAPVATLHCGMTTESISQYFECSPQVLWLSFERDVQTDPLEETPRESTELEVYKASQPVFTQWRRETLCTWHKPKPGRVYQNAPQLLGH